MNKPEKAVMKPLIDQLNHAVNVGAYRNAAEMVIEHMVGIADDHEDTETVKQLNDILNQLSHIVNIDWLKAETVGHYDVPSTDI